MTAPESNPPKRADLGPWAWFALLPGLVLAYFAGRFVLPLEHLGWDTWPMILTSRIQGFGDFIDTFGEELMDGRYPLGRFYRPIANLSFALDHGMYGVDARGFHRTDLLILLATCTAVFALGRRLGGRGLHGVLVAGFAAIVFALHPMHVEALPVSARRADTLAVLFTLLALLALPRSGGIGPRAILCGVLTLLAVGSKETGAIAIPLVSCLAWVEGQSKGWAGCKGALLRTAPAWGGLLVFVVARTLVLGGLGGHPDSSIVEGIPRMGGILGTYGPALVAPQPLVDDPSTAPERAKQLALILGLLAVALAFAKDLGEGRARRAGLGFLGLWLLGLLAITGISGELQSWYAIPFLPGFALLIGHVASRAVVGLRGGGYLLGIACAAMLISTLSTGSRHSALARDYPSWRRVSEAEKAFFEQYDRQLGAFPGGTSFTVHGLPMGLQTPPDRVGVRSAAGVSDYGVQARSELVHPDRPVKVILIRGGTPPREAGTTVIGVVPGAIP